MNIFKLYDTSSTSNAVRSFSGVNFSDEKKAGDLLSAVGVTTERYPFLANSGDVYKLSDFEEGDILGMLVCDKLAYIVDNRAAAKLYYGGVDTGVVLESGRKRLVRMGTKILIFPDKVSYDTKTGDAESLEAFYNSAEGVPVGFSLCDIDGATLDVTFSNTAPDCAADGTLWCDTSGDSPVVKIRSEAMWSEMLSVYTKITSVGVGSHFRAGDGVKITVGGELFEGGWHVIEAVGDDSIVIPGAFEGVPGALSVSRELPVTDFEIECQNRLFACRWGLDGSGDFVNEIYVSKLGDPTNFNCFEGISSDSYTVSLGSEGAFTGAFSYLNTPVFFKERCLHKLFGSRPSDFTVVTVEADGVASHSPFSLAKVGEILFYVSENTLMAYDGAYPVRALSSFGDLPLRDATLCAAGSDLYISCSVDGAKRLFVLDTKRMLLTERNNVFPDITVSSGRNLYAAKGGSLYLLAGDPLRAESESGFDAVISESVPWCFETSNLAGDISEYIYKIILRMKVAAGGTVSVSARFSESGDYESVGCVKPCVESNMSIPLMPRRSDWFSLRFEGTGDFVLYSISRFLTFASENAPFRF